MTTTIVNEKDVEVLSLARPLTPEQFDPLRAVDHRIELPLDRLAAGSYLLRIATSAGKESAAREVRFVVR